MSSSARRTRGLGALFALALSGAAGSGLVTSCLELREGVEHNGQAYDSCTRCHGDATRQGSALRRVAPPKDTKGNTDVRYPGVGAHELHLSPGATHAALRCDECHEVPERDSAPGHYDSDTPAEIVFGELASRGRSSRSGEGPRYDASARSCSDTYCHGRAEPIWTLPRTSEQACGSCHGLPPAAPHPQFDDCSRCHSEVIAGDRTFVDESKHVDGVVQSDETGCRDCHGGEENAAPPRDLAGRTQVSARGVGAHQAHLTGGVNGRALACDECHVVPREPNVPGHLDGLGVEIVFTGIGARPAQGGLALEPTWDGATLTCSGSWCHGLGEPGATSAAWTEPGPLACDACHGMPPSAPHPPVQSCELCHDEVAGSGQRITDPTLHVDGTVQQRTPSVCTDCHGMPGEDERGPPPRDTLGNSVSTERGVGAHTAHLVGSGNARPLACEECHVVPATWDAPGHIDTAGPAEVVLRGVASAFEATPVYRDGSCANTYCHGGSFIGGRPSGGQHVTPSWTVVDGSQVTCEGCHGMPPPAPHPQPASDCSECHHNIDAELRFDPATSHVDGKVNFFDSREDAARGP